MNILKYVIYTVIFTVTLVGQISLNGSTNPKIDSLKTVLDTSNSVISQMKANLELGYMHLESEPTKSRIYSKRALDLALKLKDKKGIQHAYSDLAFANYNLENLDSFRIVLLESVDYFKANQMEDRLAVVYRNLAKIGERNGQPDSSMAQLDISLKYLEQYPDSTTLADVYLSRGFAYRTMGYFNLSLEALFKSLNLFEDLGNRHRMSYALQNIGINNAIMDRHHEAILYSQKACEIFNERNNYRALAQTKNNLGKMYLAIGEIDSARISHRASIYNTTLQKQDWVLIQNCWNLGRLEYQENRYDSALFWLDKTEDLALQYNDTFLLGGTSRYKALIAIEQGNSTTSNDFLNKSLRYYKAFSDPNTNSEIHHDYSKLYGKLKLYEKAFESRIKGEQIDDSLFTLKVNHQIAELNLQYETEKKNLEIKNLEQEIKIEESKKKSLIIGLLALMLAALSIIYALWQRRKKEKLIYQKEKEVEAEKRKIIELELEYKKKELTAKALQLAKKNEFLLELETQITNLKSNIDTNVRSTTQKISRMIHHDVEDDDEWDQFAESFSNLHQGYLDTLTDKHGSLSKSEIRLVSLLKMNLSSKDIANILRISPEGIKKARYRLRKKLEIPTEVELQGYLNSISEGVPIFSTS